MVVVVGMYFCAQHSAIGRMLAAIAIFHVVLLSRERATA